MENISLAEKVNAKAVDQGSALSQYHYERFQSLILNRTGMLFGFRRRNALARGVLKTAQKAGCEHLEDYYTLLVSTQTDSTVWENLIDEITIGETYFFRDSSQIHILRTHILPGLISGHRHDRRLRIWSAGCASGEEPYTIAMLLSEMLLDAGQWNVFILATDINKRVIEKAQRGFFREWSFRQTDPAIRSRYFRPKENGFELIQRVRDTVTFNYLNLSEACYPSLATNTNALDLILCRNVAIYQSEEVVREVVERFYGCLVSGGWLMVGAAETGIPVYGKFAARRFSSITVFQKTSEFAPISAVPVAERKTGITSERMVGPPIRPALPPVLQPQAAAELKTEDTPAERQETIPAAAIEDPSHLFEEGLTLVSKKRFEEALNIFQACIAMDATHTPALFQLGQVCANLGRLEEAESWCLQAIEKDALMVEAHYTLALICQEKGAREEAVDRLKKALFLKSDFALGHFSLSMLYKQVGQNERSERHRRQAIRLAFKVAPEAILPGSDDLTAAQMLTMARAIK